MAGTIDDGGPAFPTSGFTQIGDQLVPTAEGGMSIRTYLASSAGAARYAEECMGYRTVGELQGALGKNYTQAQAWIFFVTEYADALIAELKKGGA